MAETAVTVNGEGQTFGGALNSQESGVMSRTNHGVEKEHVVELVVNVAVGGGASTCMVRVASNFMPQLVVP